MADTYFGPVFTAYIANCSCKVFIFTDADFAKGEGIFDLRNKLGAQATLRMNIYPKRNRVNSRLAILEIRA